MYLRVAVCPLVVSTSVSTAFVRWLRRPLGLPPNCSSSTSSLVQACFYSGVEVLGDRLDAHRAS